MILTLETILTFGKHEGAQIEDLVYDDPEYVRWLVEDTDHEADDELLNLLAEKGVAG